MARKIIFSITLATVIYLTICFAAVVESNDVGTQSSVVSRPRQRMEVVTMADFYMRDGNAVSGRLLSNDSTQIVIEQLLDSTLVTKAYSKREIDPRTLKTRPVPEYRYYTGLAEYFAARTWDFRDDPDDFIAAIRSYEKAKQSLQASGTDGERISEIDTAIKKLEQDRDVWTREVESRAKLKKLEYEAEAETRLKNLEKRVAENNVRLNESTKYLDKTADDMKRGREQLEQTISQLNKDIVGQIQVLQNQIVDNRAAINDIWYRCCWRILTPAPTPK
jgi:peptidoglycan hydrolase CwlO-like protein